MPKIAITMHNEKLAKFNFFKKTIQNASENIESGVKKGLTEGTKKAMSGLQKFLLVGGGTAGAGGVGYLTGRLHGAQKLNTALQTYNEAENTAIANEFYNRGLMDKQGADTKSLFALGGLLGLAGAGGYVGGRLHQKVRNQELVNKFNAVNPAENQEIAAAAYELGKSASLAGDVVNSFKAIPKSFRWKIIHGMARRKKEAIQKLRETNPALYAQQHGMAKERLYERAMRFSKDKHEQAHKDSALAHGIIGTATGLAGGAVFVKNIPPHHKEKFNKLMEQISMKKEANLFTNFINAFKAGRKVVHSPALEKKITETIHNPELTRQIYKAHPDYSKAHIDTGFKKTKHPQPDVTIKDPAKVKTTTSDEAVAEAFSRKPKSDSIEQAVADYAENKKAKAKKWNERIRNFGTAAAGVGVGAAGIGLGYNLATRPRSA